MKTHRKPASTLRKPAAFAVTLAAGMVVGHVSLLAGVAVILVAAVLHTGLLDA